ncbi:MAG: hypothetical protein V7696_18060 [Halioglobus sp.]
MPVIEKVSGAAARRIRAALLFLWLLLLIWRLFDLVEEAITGTLKMSIGTWGITGVDAGVVQLVIVGALGCIVFIAYSHTRQELSPGSKDP